MPPSPPNLVILAGPNGAGKTTISREVLDRTLGIAEFVNADTIAAGLSGFDPDRVAFAAGRIMLARLKELAAQRADFAFETTLASRTFAPWIEEVANYGYIPHLYYVWLRTPRLAVARVRARVKQGGHHVEEAVIRRRYRRSVANLVHLYSPIIAAAGGTLRIYDNSASVPSLIAAAESSKQIVYNQQVFDRLTEIDDGRQEDSEDRL